jgi:hypothetical protein
LVYGSIVLRDNEWTDCGRSSTNNLSQITDHSVPCSQPILAGAPLLGSKSNRRIENFTRVETLGYPDVHWIHVTIDDNDPNVFSFRPRIVANNLVKH